MGRTAKALKEDEIPTKEQLNELLTAFLAAVRLPDDADGNSARFLAALYRAFTKHGPKSRVFDCDAHGNRLRVPDFRLARAYEVMYPLLSEVSSGNKTLAYAENELVERHGFPRGVIGRAISDTGVGMRGGFEARKATAKAVGRIYERGA